MARRRRPRRSGAIAEFPPAKLLGQIALLQGILYGSLTPLMLFTALVSGRDFSFDLVFGWSAFRGDTTQGWLIALIWIIAAGLFSALAIVIFVGRSKLVLDFALTLHAVHLAIVFFYTRSLPANLTWWAAMAISSTLAVAVGTWGCRHRELRPISFGGGAAAVTGAAASGGGSGAEASGDNGAAAAAAGGDDVAGDEEQGFSRGRGRGRGRDGAGEYEMVPVKAGENSRQD